MNVLLSPRFEVFECFRRLALSSLLVLFANEEEPATQMVAGLIERVRPHLVAFTILTTRDTDPSDTGLELLSHDKFVVTHAGPPRFNWHLHTLGRGR